MKSSLDKERHLQEAKKSIRRLKLFYIHLAGYIVAIGLLSYNLYIVAGPYKDNIIALNLSLIGAWTVFILIHAWNIFKGKKVFNKKWEEKKIKDFLEENEETETTLWE